MGQYTEKLNTSCGVTLLLKRLSECPIKPTKAHAPYLGTPALTAGCNPVSRIISLPQPQPLHSLARRLSRTGPAFQGRLWLTFFPSWEAPPLSPAHDFLLQVPAQPQPYPTSPLPRRGALPPSCCKRVKS